MSFPPRRIVTGHDAQGRATVVHDEVADNVIARRPGHRSAVLWSTDEVPADIEDSIDGAARARSQRSIDRGTVFRIAEYAPGVTSARHQTGSIDYAVVVAGEIDLVLDDEVVRLRPGDTLIQRGTAHDWVNSGGVPCIIAFCLVGARAGSVAEASSG
jgi:quercetin dioxygenase-like cupin family protein